MDYQTTILILCVLVLIYAIGASNVIIGAAVIIAFAYLYTRPELAPFSSLNKQFNGGN
jgi:hypothetical protein